jgi:pimeloyl-ACP methyl ester carboxylesterase
VVLLNHWGANLDNFDPQIVDNISKGRRVIAINYRGIGLSSGIAPLTIGEMADDVISIIHKLGLKKVILFGFSLGGFVAQDIALKNPGLIEKLILTGTGPAGGTGINQVGKISWPLIIKGFLTFRDPKFYLFFTSTKNGKTSANQYLNRLCLFLCC